jgi:hypothetical protein
MAITKRPPNTIKLSDGGMLVNTESLSEAVVAGMLLERADVSGAFKWKKHSGAAGVVAPVAFALDRNMLNEDIDASQPVGDLPEVWIPYRGSTVWALVASGAVLTQGDLLNSAGTGYLQKGTANPVGRVLETTTANTATFRVRCEVV